MSGKRHGCFCDGWCDGHDHRCYVCGEYVECMPPSGVV